MQKETIFSLLRTILTLVGTYLIGKNIFGHTVDDNIFTVISASLITLVSVVWGIVDKTATIEGVQSGVRSVFIGLGGLAVSWGFLKSEQLVAILGVLAPLLTLIQSYTSKVKVKQIHSGKVRTDITGKVIRMLLFFIFSSSLVHGQSLFKRVPAPQFKVASQSLLFNPNELSTLQDSTWTGIRPILGVAAFSEPGNQLMTGAGVGYQKLIWDYTTSHWSCQYSVSILAWAAGSVSPGPQIPAFAFGPAVGLFNNLVLVGGGYDFTHGRWIGALSFGVSLN